MAYNADQTWDSLVLKLERHGRPFKNLLILGKELYEDWQSFRGGRDNATIAVDLEREESEIAELDSAYAAFKEFHDMASNIAVSQGDRLFSLRKFV